MHLTRFRIRQSGPLSGRLTLPGDKSISHRSVIIGSIASGTTRIRGILQGEDVKRTMQAFRDCGVRIESQGEWLIVEGVGLDGLKAPRSEIYLGNSGTSMRLLTGLFSAQNFETVFTGDESLSRRPMERVVKPLRSMGANISLAEGGTPPVRIHPIDEIKAIEWNLTVASAQVRSAILLAGLYAKGQTRVIEPKPIRNHTSIMLAQFGCKVHRTGLEVTIEGRPNLQGQQLEIPADFSSAAFFIVEGLLVPRSELVLKKIGVNETRTGLLSALELMGASIQLDNFELVGNEPIADIRVRSDSQLNGIDLPLALVPLMIDEIPILAIAAARSKGRTVISGCEELRVKESDRIRTVVIGLNALGIEVEERPDGMIIEGGTFQGGQVDSFGDHRIAMAFSIAGTVAEGEIEILNCDCVNTSFPEFTDVARQCGMELVVEGEQVDE
ncbi:MAG: 3-phosphoshikimate 1-carboxyvinyltransferase [Gammaproteobacteria bacterium]|nr:3-phosphoshikimate 1-carboxyvinyltransferase [Gammaproteobacteria bacterium]